MAQASQDTGSVHDLEEARTKRFFQRLGDHAFLAIIVDEDDNEVIIYAKGMDVTGEVLRRMRVALDEAEARLKE